MFIHAETEEYCEKKIKRSSWECFNSIFILSKMIMKWFRLPVSFLDNFLYI